MKSRVGPHAKKHFGSKADGTKLYWPLLGGDRCTEAMANEGSTTLTFS